MGKEGEEKKERMRMKRGKWKESDGKVKQGKA